MARDRQGPVRLALLAALLTGCTTPPDRIEPLNVLPGRYLALNCAQLQAEGDAVARQLVKLRERIERANRVTEGATAIVAWWVLWPELLYHRTAIAPQDRAEYARLLGEQRTIVQVAAQLDCPRQPPAVPEHALPPAAIASGTR